MSLPKYQENEDYGYIIDILDHEETNVCHIDNLLYDRQRLPISPYTIPSATRDDDADYILILVEEGRAEESYMTKAKKSCTEFICNLWKK